MAWKVLFFYLFTSSAWAGVYITQEISLTGGTETKKLQAVFYFETDRIRLEIGKDIKHKSITIVDAKKKTVTNIVPDLKNYFEVPLKEVRAQMRKNVEMALEGLQRELKEKLSAVKREEVQRSIAQLSTSEYTFKLADSGKKKGKWTCDVYEVLAGEKGPTIGEICAVALKKLGLELSDFQAMDTFGDYLAKSFGGLVNGLKTFGDFGFPVWSLSRGPLTTTFLTTHIERKRLKDGLFKVPRGYVNVGPTALADPEPNNKD